MGAGYPGGIFFGQYAVGGVAPAPPAVTAFSPERMYRRGRESRCIRKPEPRVVHSRHTGAK